MFFRLPPLCFCPRDAQRLKEADCCHGCPEQLQFPLGWALRTSFSKPCGPHVTSPAVQRFSSTSLPVKVEDLHLRRRESSLQ
jgi:hypothetical protein